MLRKNIKREHPVKRVKRLKMNKKVAIVGAGIAGITTAYYLARAGHEVVIYDKRKHPAMATSYGNGGQLSASNAETWNLSLIHI